MITTMLKMVLMLTLRVLFLEDSDVASVKGGVLTIHNLDEDMVKVNRLSSSSSSQWSSSSCYHPSIHNLDGQGDGRRQGGHRAQDGDPGDHEGGQTWNFAIHLNVNVILRGLYLKLLS